jgi:hypothetical protein
MKGLLCYSSCARSCQYWRFALMWGSTAATNLGASPSSTLQAQAPSHLFTARPLGAAVAKQEQGP